jgi:protein kinase C substrate 80K-H
VEDRLKTLGTEIEAGELKVKQMEAELAEVERREKGKVVKAASQKVGKLGVLVGLAQQRTDELREALERTKSERDASRGRVQELEGLLTTFKEEYNPNFNDEGVKRAVRAWEDYAARDKGPEPDAAHDRDLDAMLKSDKDNGLDWEEYQGDDESDTDVCECGQPFGQLVLC